MKNIIFNYNTYSKDIFKDSNIYIKLIYFSGIKFISGDEKDNYYGFVSFQAIDENNKISTISFSVKFDNEHEYVQSVLQYEDLKIVGSASTPQIPNLVPLSCFFKEKADCNNNEEWFVLYCRLALSNNDSKTVYKVCISRSGFLSIMHTFNRLRNHLETNYYDSYYLNDCITASSKVIKITSKYVSKVIAVYFLPPSSFFDNRITGLSIIDLINTNTKNTSFRLCIPLDEDKKIKKISNNKVYFDKNKFTKYLESLNLSKIDLYYCNDYFGIEYSISANTPMRLTSMICTNIDNPKLLPIILDFNQDVFNKIYENIYIYIKK